MNLFGRKQKEKASNEALFRKPLVDPNYQKVLEKRQREQELAKVTPIKSPGRPPIDRWQAVQLRNSGFSIREIARIMRVSPSSVHRAIKHNSSTNIS